MITQKDILELCNAASYAGYSANPNNLILSRWDSGEQTHIPLKLPADNAAIYIFKWNDTYLKVGKVNPNSSARYQSQHYNPESSRSNLSKSLLDDPEFRNFFNDGNIGKWLKANTTRFNIVIPSSLGKNFVHFAEAFFILKCNPRFENTRA